MAVNKIDKLLMVSDFNENLYLGVFWSEELVGGLNSDMGVVWGLLCLHPNTIRPNYYYYYSSSSRRDFFRPNSQRLTIWSLLIFTGRWITITRGAFKYWNFQNGRRCHGNRERMSKPLTPLISETAKGFPQDLAYILSRVGRIFWQKKIAYKWPPFWKWPPTKSAKFQCSLVSMKIYI
jgi:hypothetical protein